MLNPSLAIINANVITLNPKQPRAEAILIENGRIVTVGTNKKIRKHVNKKTRIINARNKAVIPGLVDCHVHMTGFGQYLQTLELRNASSIREVQRKLREYSRKNPEKNWILGGRWDQEKFTEKRYPTRWDLDAAVADKPVFLTRVCGHTGVANSKALQLAGIKKDTNVESGQVDLDEATGEPNGVLRENAVKLVWKIIPKPSQEDLEETCVLACKEAVEAGLTCVHWMLGSAKEMQTLQKLNSEGRLPLRVYLGVPVELLDDLVGLGLMTGFGSDMIKIGFVKLFADGSLGTRTAALKKPYSDKPETCGIMLYEQKKLNDLVLKAHNADLQLAIHAIGDRAMEAVLEAYEKALEQFPRENHRHRIEHCSVLNPKMIKEMKRLDLVASVQPHFVPSDFWATDRVGKKRARWTYAFKTLMKGGLTVVSGSDCPVENINPILGVWAATTREDFPEENLTVQEALQTYTLNAAYASFDEDKKGSIEVGKFADLTVLSDDLFAVPPDKIKDIAVEFTVVNGKVVYAK
jgi:predicted amidohydrolase YtcJ